MLKNIMKVLIGCIFFRDYTGSELYVYELAIKLITLGCEVHVITAHLGGPLTDQAIKNGIYVHHLSNAPDIEFDIIHTQHVPITENLIAIYPNIPKITTIHSEIIDLERPVLHPTIHRFIAIRPEIKEYLKNFNILQENIQVIYNPIDETRFFKKELPSENFILFVGSLESLRRNAIFETSKYAEENGKELWIVGKNHSNYLNELLQKQHVKFINVVQNVEEYVHRCDETSGILLGRTTIEGWMCNKPGWIYSVNSQGAILDKQKYEVPLDVEKYHAINVAKSIKKIYEEVILL
jgi:glycosyltransferase involved in cell wall biosynthesis